MAPRNSKLQQKLNSVLELKKAPETKNQLFILAKLVFRTQVVSCVNWLLNTVSVYPLNHVEN